MIIAGKFEIVESKVGRLKVWIPSPYNVKNHKNREMRV
jgi:hypothetical protein